MLSSLPPELLRDIIEATVPHTFRSTTYKERQKTLCSLSLVSKLFRSIAQPLLYEIVWVKSVRQLEILPSSISDSGGGANVNQRIKSAVISLKEGIDLLPENVGAGFPEFTNVETFTWNGGYVGRVDLFVISIFPSMLTLTLAAASRPQAHNFLLEIDLSSLHLSGCKAASTEHVILPNLRSLTLCFVDEDLTLTLLNPDSLPRLEEFACYDDPAKLANIIDRSSLHRLLPRLESLIFHLYAWRNLADAEVRSAASRTLVDCHSYQLSDLSKSTHQPVHLRVYGLSKTDEDTRLTTFFEETADLTSHIESNPSLPLRSVYLTCDDSSTVHLSSTSQGYVENLSRICQARKIELIFETGPSFVSLDPCFSPDFSRRMKEQRRKESVSEV